MAAENPLMVYVDLDNTIAIYNKAISRVCSDKKIDYPSSLVTKKEISDYFKTNQMNDTWTQIQGYCYGEYMEYAEPAEESVKLLEKLGEMGYQVHLVSHKTQRPASCLDVDLRQHADKWLFENFPNVFLTRLFFDTKKEKIQYIQDTQPDFMVDDLPEVLTETGLGRKKSILIHSSSDEIHKDYTNCENWSEAFNYISAGENTSSIDR